MRAGEQGARPGEEYSPSYSPDRRREQQQQQQQQQPVRGGGAAALQSPPRSGTGSQSGLLGSPARAQPSPGAHYALDPDTGALYEKGGGAQALTGLAKPKKKKREPTVIFDPRRVPFVRADLRQFVLAPLPDGAGPVMRCCIERRKGLTKISPVYEMRLARD
jgi:hypothetical protein